MRKRPVLDKVVELMRSLLFVPGDSQRKLEKALDIRRGCAAHRPGGFRRARRQGQTRGGHRRVPRASCGRRPTARASTCASTGSTTGLIEADLDAVMPCRARWHRAAEGAWAAWTSRISARSSPCAKPKAACPTAQRASSPSPPRTPPASSRSARFAGASHRLMGLAWGGEDLSADLGAETNRGDDGLYTDPYRIARALTLFGAAAAAVDAIDSVYTNFRDHDGLARRMPSRPAATDSSPRWPSTRPRSPSSTRPSRRPSRRSRARRRWSMRSRQTRARGCGGGRRDAGPAAFVAGGAVVGAQLKVTFTTSRNLKVA